MFRSALVLVFFIQNLLGQNVSAQAAGAPKGLSVRVIEAKMGDFSDRTEALGTLKANESVVLTVNVSETISAIHFEDGQNVKAGDILVEMVSAEEAALLVEARTNANEAKRQLDRIKQLVKAGTASESTYDQRLRDYESAKARLTAVQSRLKDRVVIAPFDGVVGLRNVSLGALVQPGDHITTLTDDRTMKLDFSVPSIFIPVLEKGMPVRAGTRVYPETLFQGDVTSIDNQIDPVTRSIAVRAVLPNDQDLLKQGMLMNVEVLMNQRKQIGIPEEALLPKGKDNFVIVAVKKGAAFVAERRKVTVASRRAGEVEIAQGLSPGDIVVTHGAFKAKPGAALTFSRDKSASKDMSTAE